MIEDQSREIAFWRYLKRIINETNNPGYDVIADELDKWLTKNVWIAPQNPP